MLLFCCRYMNRGGVDNIGLLQQPIFAPLLLRAPLATSPPRLLPASCSARLRDVRSIDQIEQAKSASLAWAWTTVRYLPSSSSRVPEAMLTERKRLHKDSCVPKGMFLFAYSCSMHYLAHRVQSTQLTVIND